MTPSIQSFSARRQVEIDTNLDIVALAPDTHLFRRTVAVPSSCLAEGATMDPGNDSVVEGVVSGFVNDAGRQRLLSGQALEKSDSLPLVWMDDATQEDFRVRGFDRAAESLWKRGQGDPWKFWEAHPDADSSNLVVVDHGSHMLLDRSGRCLPVGLFFSYIENRIDEGNCDLRAVYEHLISRDDVQVIPGNESHGSSNRASSYKEALFHIPSYNTEEGRTQSLQFMWMPRQADYDAAFNGDEDRRGWRVMSVLVSDVLGLKQFMREPLEG